MLDRIRSLVLGLRSRGNGGTLRPARAPLLRSFAVASHGVLPALSRLAMRRVALAPATVLAQLEPFRVVPLALIRLVVPALALFTGESRSDPDVSAGHLALPKRGGWSGSGTGPRACLRTPPGAGSECS